MNNEILSLMFALEVKGLVKQGIPLEEAAEIAAKRIAEEASKAEFSAYCKEHNC